ncbi:MAG: GAF domain-containing sensor histidine kinase [Desulfobacterales bacterium]|nr:MAG: GAF domain-containing sensor histidine kinase [Desulfobacterales bacterium]
MRTNSHKGVTAFFYELGREEPLSKLGWWILLRWILLGLIILTTPLVNKLIHLNVPVLKVLGLCGLVLGLNALLQYKLFLLKKTPDLDLTGVERITYLQFVSDWLFIALLFHYTGGMASPFLFYFLFHVILSGVLLERWVCLVYVTLIAVTITGLALLPLFGYLPPIYSPAASRALQDNPFLVLMLLFLFHLVLYVSSAFLSMLLQRSRERIGQLMDLQQKFEHANQKLQLLNKLAKDTASTLGLDPRLDYICRNIRYLMGVKGVAIRLLDESTNRLELVSACGLSEAYINKGPVDADKSLAQALQGEPHFVLDAATDPSVQYPEEARQEGIVGMLSFPLKGREKVIGTLRLYTGEQRRFSPEEIDFLAALSGQGAISIENARIYDALDRQDKAKNEFIILMTHELKGPLTAVQGLLEVVLKGYVGTSTPKQQELIERVYRRIESVLDVSAGLLDIYQWKTRRIDVPRTPLSIKEQVQRAVELFRAVAQDKGLTLSIALPDEDLTLMGTEEEMEKILNNLITNAIKYTPKGGRVTLRLAAVEGKLVLGVQDTGIGIAADDIPKIFDEFFRTREAKRIDPDGRGLGLPFVKRIVDSLGGKITVKSEKGKGTEFVLTFPQI